MTKKIKLSFEKLENELNIMSPASLAFVLGGNAGNGPLPSGYCVFNSLGYINQLLGAPERTAENVLGNFHDQKGTGDFVFDSNGNVDSIRFGSGPNDMNNFISTHYNTTGYASTHGQVQSNLSNGTIYMAAKGNHNVVITGYDAAANEYITYDATTGKNSREAPNDLSNLLGIKSISTDTTVPWTSDEMDGIPTTTIPDGPPSIITTFPDL